MKDLENVENLFMSLGKEERITLIRKLTDMDSNIVWCPIYDKEECVKYLYYDGDSIDHYDFDEYVGDIEESEYDDVIEFMKEGSEETLWDILNLDRFERYMFSDLGFHLSEGGTREDFFLYTFSSLVDKVYNHPLYVSIRRDKKLEKLGI
jgi:hypothetical protein